MWGCRRPGRGSRQSTAGHHQKRRLSRLSARNYHNGRTGIIFGITGLTVDHNYAVAGICVDYEYHGQRYSTLSWGCDAACVSMSATTCKPWGDKVNAILEKMVGIPQ
jgi:hypothetical protein